MLTKLTKSKRPFLFAIAGLILISTGAYLAIKFIKTKIATNNSPKPAQTINKNRLDYFGNNLSDWAVLSAPVNGKANWKIARNDSLISVNLISSVFLFGNTATDSIPAFGNYFGTSAADAIVWRDSDPINTYYYFHSTDGADSQFEWGEPGDLAGAEGDYDGDGVIDPTVVREPGNWFIFFSKTSTYISFNFGNTSADAFLPGADYTGDGRDDPAIVRLSAGNEINWLISDLNGDLVQSRSWGDFDTDFIIPGGDYDGDGKADFAVWRGISEFGGEGVWYILENDGGQQLINWGVSGLAGGEHDIPLRHGDYDGDGITDAAVWRRSNQTFYVRRSSDKNFIQQQWGEATDIPVASFGTF